MSYNHKCDFCGKGKEDVTKLIVGESVGICNDCVNLCLNILTEEKNKVVKDTKHINPVEIKEYLDQYIIGQEKAKIALSVAVSQHFKRIHNSNEKIKLDKTNVLLLGPTGCGKTMIAKKIAEYLDLPFAICDATSLTEAGYVGDDVETILTRLINEADGDIEKASKGIIYIDEIDKISKKSENASLTRDVSGEGVQQGLLKIIEGSVVRVPNSGKRKHPNNEVTEIDTSNILFICGGAFVGLDKIIQERLNHKTIGFHNEPVDKNQIKNVYNEINVKDLVKFGLIPEFVGRFSCVVGVEELDEKQLVDILQKTKNSLIDQYKYIFELDNLKLSFKSDSLIEIAKKAKTLKTNARGLKNILEEVLLPYQFEAINLYEKGLSEIIITKDTINGEKALLIFNKKIQNEQN